MTGQKISDPSDAGGTLWLDVAQRDWSDTLLDASGMRRAQMPALVDSCAASGFLLPAVAQSWGLSPQVQVAGGGGDGAASAVGIGAINPGDSCLLSYLAAALASDECDVVCCQLSALVLSSLQRG